MRNQFFKLWIFITLLFIQNTVQGVEDPRESMALYGSEVPKTGGVITLKTAIANIVESQDQLQKISGIVTKVCQKKGCWMILTDDVSHARITFKNYEFFVPARTGRVNAIVYGKLTETTLSEKRVKHYARDTGKSGESIKGPKKEYSIVASGVYLDKIDKK